MWYLGCMNGQTDKQLQQSRLLNERDIGVGYVLLLSPGEWLADEPEVSKMSAFYGHCMK